jgi:hypothetical protein
MMWWILLAALVLLALAVMFLPLGLELSYRAGRYRFYAILAGLHILVPRWVIAKVKGRIRRHGEASAEQKAEEDESPDPDGNSGGIPKKSSVIVRLLGLHDLRSILDFVVRMLRTLRVRIHHLHVRIASPDPAWTGAVYGWSCAIVSSLPPDWPVSVEADWNGEVPQASYRVEVSVIPARVLATLTGIYYRKRVQGSS